MTSTTRPAFICASCARSLRRAAKPTTPHRAFSSGGSSSRDSYTRVAVPTEDRMQLPRWKQTPPAMKMAFRLRPMPNQPKWKVNEDQELLDKALDRFIGDAAGRGVKGRDVLTDEVKWLAVTHKSFEQGAQGYNDRLAFLGKRILDLQAAKSLLAAPPLFQGKTAQAAEDRIQSNPLKQHSALNGLENVTTFAKQSMLASNKMHGLAARYGLVRVVRWKPRQVEQLALSGIQGVMAHALCALIGAVALQKGGKVANEVVKQRVLEPLGFSSSPVL
ncbi:hypothetical protein AMS68_007151 [Peltaster fructicola]|uniref:RNase III domain-containing protein n=1 Tax=Peltaster fructicola TaxID=286661 RepID=A0A6H0Y3P1_9PEZI|nr:hypothetical protein AMS68_007151 [Peltaster fructicola]